jgi:hypothetical protein
VIALLPKFTGFAGEGNEHPHYAANEWNVPSPTLYAAYFLLQRGISSECFGLDAGPCVLRKLARIFHFPPILRRGGGADDGSLVAGEPKLRPVRRVRRLPFHYTKGVP